MLIKDLSKEGNWLVQTELSSNARTKPFCPIYELDADYNGDRYTVYVQLESHKMYVLYAIRTRRTERETQYELITKSNILLALSELIIYQAAEHCS